MIKAEMQAAMNPEVRAKLEKLTGQLRGLVSMEKRMKKNSKGKDFDLFKDQKKQLKMEIEKLRKEL